MYQTHLLTHSDVKQLHNHYSTFPCTGRLDLAVQLSSILGKEFEMVI